MLKKLSLQISKKTMILVMSVITTVLILVIGYFVINKDDSSIQTNYGKEFQGFIEAQEVDVTAEDILNYKTRPVRLTIIRKLDINEYDQIAGAGKYDYQTWSYYEAIITHDYSNDTVIEENIILSQFGNEEWQIQGDPLLSVGQEYIIFLAQNKETDGYWGAYLGRHSIYDVVKEKDGEFLYKRGVTLPVPDKSNSNAMEKNSVITTNPKNPVFYSQKITQEDFIPLIKNKK